MGKCLACFDAILNKISHAVAYFSGLCFLIVAFIVTYEIIARGIFNSPTEWVLEISTYLVIIAGFLGMAITLRKRAHVCVDFLTSHFSEKTHLYLEIITTIFSLVVFAIFLNESISFVELTLRLNKLSPSTLRFPLYIPQLSLIAGALLLELELLNQLMHAIQKSLEKEHE